jgi:hypothetical protein
MFHLNPVSYTKANDHIRSIYEDIENVLQTRHVPIFFQMIANFEEYLSYIWPQIKRNIQDKQFQEIVKSIENVSVQDLADVYNPDKEILDYVHDHIKNKSVYTIIKKDMSDVTHMNVQMAFIFITLREAVKGWAVGAPKLGENMRYDPMKQKVFSEINENFNDSILDEFTGLPALTTDFYPKLLALCVSEMEELITKKEYLYSRVEMEERFLSEIPDIPHPIDSSYSKVSKFAYKYPHFDELLYMLSETFPTIIINKLSTSIVGLILLK